MADENKTTATTKPSARPVARPASQAAKSEPDKTATAKTAGAPAPALGESKAAVKQETLPPSGNPDMDSVTIEANGQEEMGGVEDADPTGLSDPNMVMASSQPVANVRVPNTVARETMAGVEIRPEKEPPVIGYQEPSDRETMLQRMYGTHSGKVGNTVPIVDDYTPENPTAGGMIGGDGGPKAAGRIRAGQEKERAAQAVIDGLVKGTSAAQELERLEQQDNDISGKSAYKVVGGAIFTESGKAFPGQKVMLSKEEAKHFDGMGRLGPWIE